MYNVYHSLEIENYNFGYHWTDKFKSPHSYKSNKNEIIWIVIN